MNRRPSTICWRVAAAFVALAAITLTTTLLLTGDDAPRPAASTFEDCAMMGPGAPTKACFSAAISRQMTPKSDPNSVLVNLEATMLRLGSYPATACHVIMHTVGRRYAVAHKVTLATLTRIPELGLFRADR